MIVPQLTFGNSPTRFHNFNLLGSYYLTFVGKVILQLIFAMFLINSHLKSFIILGNGFI